MLRKEAQYVQTVDECLINEQRESRNKKREGASLGAHRSVRDTRPAVVSPAPLNNPSPKGDPPNGPTKDKNKNKKANRGSFLFDFRIPGVKEEVHLGAGALPQRSFLLLLLPTPVMLQAPGHGATTGVSTPYSDPRGHIRAEGGSKPSPSLKSRGRGDKVPVASPAFLLTETLCETLGRTPE